MSFREGVLYALEACLASGDQMVTVSATVVCRLSETSFAATSRVQKTPFLVRMLRGASPDSGVVLARDSGTIVLFEEDSSTWTVHTPGQAKHWEALKETCAGIGALGKGAESCGFRVPILDELQPVTCNLLRMISPAHIVEGDVACLARSASCGTLCLNQPSSRQVSHVNHIVALVIAREDASLAPCVYRTFFRRLWCFSVGMRSAGS